MSFEAADVRQQAAALRQLTAACRLLPAALFLLLLLPACRIGSGFDTAEKRRNLMWDETPVVEISDTPKQPEELPPEALKAPPIVYLLVAG